MWTDIVDEQGRKRARIFYKAAFYDRHAHMCLASRYRIEREYAERPDEDFRPLRAWVVDNATGETLHSVSRTAEWDPLDAARGWLNVNRPNAGDPVKAWADVDQLTEG